MRTDSEQQTAWTEGPWAVRDGTPEGGGQVWEITSPHAPDVNCNEVASSWENEPTARLIALAPEMAEAILDLDNWDCNCDEPYSRQHHSKLDCCNLREVAEKLRQIEVSS